LDVAELTLQPREPLAPTPFPDNQLALLGGMPLLHILDNRKLPVNEQHHPHWHWLSRSPADQAPLLRRRRRQLPPGHCEFFASGPIYKRKMTRALGKKWSGR
jgi:hypothetical protein